MAGVLGNSPYSVKAARGAWSASHRQSLPRFKELRDNTGSRPAKSARLPRTLRCASNTRGAQSSLPQSKICAIFGAIHWNACCNRNEATTAEMTQKLAYADDHFHDYCGVVGGYGHEEAAKLVNLG